MSAMSDFAKHGGRPSDDDIIRALAQHFDAPESAAIAWLAAIHTRFDAKAAQERVVDRQPHPV